MVVLGLAFGLAIVALLNPVVGLQLYVVAPVAVNVVEEPAQIGLEPLVAFTVGIAVTVTVDVAVLEQPLLVPVTVYVVVVVGLATGLYIEVELNPVEGNQLYVVAPFAIIETEPPEQIPGPFGVAVTFGIGFTITVTVAVLVQLPIVPVTV